MDLYGFKQNSKSKIWILTKKKVAFYRNSKLTLWVWVAVVSVLLQEVLFQELGKCCIVGHEFLVAAHLRDGAVYEHHDVVDVGQPVDSVRH